MKRIGISLIITMGLFSGIVNAQSVNYGIKGGLNLSNLYIKAENIDDENPRIGMHLGLFSQIMFADAIGIQPEILFSHKGSEASYTGLIDQTVKFNLNYIDIPVLLVVRPIEVLEIHAGPYLGILVNSKVKYSGLIEGEDEIDRDHLKTFDYGFAGGVAFNFGNLQTGIRYNMGSQEIADSDLARLLLGDSKNSYLQLYLAIKFL
jgi:hypothetical protein